jgi:hypothetical protein
MAELLDITPLLVQKPSSSRTALGTALFLGALLAGEDKPETFCGSAVDGLHDQTCSAEGYFPTEKINNNESHLDSRRLARLRPRPRTAQ